MQISKFKLPVPYKESFEVLDSSKIQTFQDSPRRFFFEHVLGWRVDEPNIHLVFGSSWHDAMEVMMREVGSYTDATVARAYNAFQRGFLDVYNDPLQETGSDKKTEGAALNALISYAEEYKNDDFTTHEVEVAGTIPISNTRLIHFKLDTIIEYGAGHPLYRPGFWSMEHKTGSMNTIGWRSKWGIIVQPWTYTHALKGLYQNEAVGVIINGVFFYKKGQAFIRIPVIKSDTMMQAGLDSVNHWVDQIEWNFKMLQEENAKNSTMFSFPCNGMSCSKFGNCPYMNMCATWANPLAKCEHGPPVGFKEEFWDPRKAEDTAKKVVHL